MWIIQTPSDIYPNRSMYLVRIDNTEDLAHFTHDIGLAKEFEMKEDAKLCINDNQLEHCHILPS